MKSMHKQRGFWDVISKVAGPLISGIASSRSQNQTNEQNYANAQEANRFSAQEAKINRDWSAIEASRDRNFQSNEAGRNRLFQNDQSDKNRGWMEDMSSSAHQREVKDLEKAGINPILSAKLGGASSPSSSAPSGSQASGSRASSSAQGRAHIPAYESAIGKGVNSALATRRLKAEVETMEANAEKARQETGLTSEKTKTESVARRHIEATMDKINFEIKRIDTDIDINELKIVNQKLDNIIKEFVTLPNGQIDVKKAQIMLSQLQMEQKVYAKHPGLKTSEVAGRSSSALGIAAGATVGGAKALKFVINKLKGMIKK